MTQLNPLTTSYSEVRSFNPCADGLIRFTNGLIHRGYSLTDTAIPLVTVCKFCTFSDVMWLLGKRQVEIEIAANAAKLCANSVISSAAKAKAKATNAAAKAATNAATNAAKAAAAAAAKATATAATAAKAAKATRDTAINEQITKNIQFLIRAIQQYERTH